MRWSLSLGRPFGIDLRVHVTFVLILFLGASQWSAHGPAGMLFGAGMMLLLFTCVTLHEFGHALVAKAYGISVREIVLLPIGGVALLGRNPDRAGQELAIAAAGPAVNVVIALVLSIALGAVLDTSGMGRDAALAALRAGPSLATAMVWLLFMNIALVVFNMIPAFPLDGGRIFRGLLGLFLPWSRATAIATRTGQVIAAAMAIFALMPPLKPVLLLIAVVVFLGAASTRVEEQARTVLSTWRVGDAYNKHALWLDERDTVSRAADYLLTSYQPDFAVMRGRDLLGVVLRERVLEALASAGGQDIPVVRIMRPDCPRVDAGASLDEVRRMLGEADCRVAAVYDSRGYLGLVSLDDIAEAQAVLSFMQRGASASGAGNVQA